MVPDWQTNTVFFADLLLRRLPGLFRKLTALLKARQVPFAVLKGSRDVWLRDFAPVQSGPAKFVQFHYRPDYLTGYSSSITSPRVFKRLNFLGQVHKSQLTIDGGNVVSDGSAAILTDKIFQENPDRSRKQIKQDLKTELDVKRLIIIPQEPADPIGHSDGMVRFIREGQIVVNNYVEFDRAFDIKLQTVLRKNHLSIERLPYIPPETSDEDIPPAFGNYVNYLRVGSLIVLPKYGLPEDREAAMRLARLIPNAEVVSIPCRDLAQEGGVLNCATWTVQLDAHKLRTDKTEFDEPGGYDGAT